MGNYKEISFSDGEETIELIYLETPIDVKDQSVSLAGFVRSRLFSEDIALVVDQRPQANLDYDYACAAMDSIGCIRVLMEPEVYPDLICGKAYAMASLFHELGHIYHKDLQDIHRNGLDYDFERLTVIENGEVHEREINADAFAIRFLNSEIVFEGLTVLREKYLAEGEGENVPTNIELTKRIQALYQG